MNKISDYKHNIEIYISSEKGKRVLNFFYSWAAAFVILGVMMEILHLRYGDVVLAISLVVESLVFIVSGLEKPQPSYKWEQVFPELLPSSQDKATINQVQNSIKEHLYSQKTKMENSVFLSDQLPNEAVSSFNFQALTDAIERLSSATDRLITLQSIDKGIENEITKVVDSVSRQEHQSANVTNDIRQLSEQLHGIHQVYATQLQAVAKQVNEIENINQTLGYISQHYQTTMKDSEELKEQSHELVEKMKLLNDVYGRLIDALSVKS